MAYRIVPQCSRQYHQYRYFDGWEREGSVFRVGKTAFIDSWEQNWKALGCLVWHHGSKDISGLDGSRVATEQYIFSWPTSGNLRECMVFLLVLEVNSC